MSGEILWFIAALTGAGLAAGFAGGLFGIGGGAVVVPALYFVFTALGVDEAVRMHVAVGTSLSTIVSTSWRSLAAHTKAGAVDYDVLRKWGPWITLGALIGAGVAGLVDNEVLLIVFGAGLLLIALQMAFSSPNWRVFRDLPHGLWRALTAGGIGLLSAMMGIGGGAFGVTVMTLGGRPIHQAVATASGFGAAIALPAALGYVAMGWGREGLPPWSLGFVSLPGFVVLAALTALTAPLGARLAHRLPQLALKRAFAVFLALVALNMLREAAF
ncbi:MAG TPA: sulfite exporter TauE/SafE family protein [Vitreimonas sp.]|uniref:sulfite exporter TauE/SafE family protein n=1 Tax=Vitreimonas sp. TaxID=3069702 RepID=UPI002D67611E|nr:sulfite exporter TauE/SafE family protein [Vitreimonas sp.]HYD86092.1 sulfite exporter TauE/SafE family protein [Vitreimonas sp.]